jgi:hypothetical protein
LWSNELKQRGVDYEDVLVEEDDDDDGDDETDLSPKNDLNRSVRFSDEVTDGSFSSEGTDDIHTSSVRRFSERTPELSVRSIPEDGVVLDADDVAALTKHMRMMEKSQERIRGILAKYDIET